MELKVITVHTWNERTLQYDVTTRKVKDHVISIGGMSLDPLDIVVKPGFYISSIDVYPNLGSVDVYLSRLRF